jgi:hypothetical protein
MVTIPIFHVRAIDINDPAFSMFECDMRVAISSKWESRFDGIHPNNPLLSWHTVCSENIIAVLA